MNEQSIKDLKENAGKAVEKVVKEEIDKMLRSCIDELEKRRASVRDEDELEKGWREKIRNEVALMMEGVPAQGAEENNIFIKAGEDAKTLMYERLKETVSTLMKTFDVKKQAWILK